MEIVSRSVFLSTQLIDKYNRRRTVVSSAVYKVRTALMIVNLRCRDGMWRESLCATCEIIYVHIRHSYMQRGISCFKADMSVKLLQITTLYCSVTETTFIFFIVQFITICLVYIREDCQNILMTQLGTSQRLIGSVILFCYLFVSLL